MSDGRRSDILVAGLLATIQRFGDLLEALALRLRHTGEDKGGGRDAAAGEEPHARVHPELLNRDREVLDD